MNVQLIVLRYGWLMLAAFALIGLGCGSARYVTVEPTGGVIAMPANNGPCREKAEQLLQQKCPRGYAIDREGEVVVGQQTSENTNYRQTSTMRTQTTRDATEWQITFHCR